MLKRINITTNSNDDNKILDNETIKIIDNYDKKLLNDLGRLYKELDSDDINIDEVKDTVELLHRYNKKREMTYLDNLIHPEKAKGCKIPSPIPVPSNSFQLHNSYTLTTNNKGNLAFVFNPFFLYSTAGLNQPIRSGSSAVAVNYFSSFYLNNDDTLTGSSPSNGKFIPMNVGQGIPNVYDQYRLVSASLIIKYIGRMDITSGVIGGAIVFDEQRNIGTYGEYQYENPPSANVASMNEFMDKYGNFDLAMDSFYHQENLCIEGLRMLYFPIDNTFEEYTKLCTSNFATLEAWGPDTYKVFVGEDYNKSGFNWMVYVLGAPVSSSCFKMDFYLNFECLPNATFLNYMPITPSCDYVSNQEKKESIVVVQKKPIMKMNEDVIIKEKDEDPWLRLKKAFQGKLPSIKKLIMNGLIKTIPMLKPGIALAGALIDTAAKVKNNLNMSIDENVD